MFVSPVNLNSDKSTQKTNFAQNFGHNQNQNSYSKKNTYLYKKIKQVDKLLKIDTKMRKLITLSAALALSMGCFAQYTLSFEANGLRKGDYRNMKQIEYVEQSNAGANQIWDFSKSKVLKDFYIEQNEDLLNTSYSLCYNGKRKKCSI